MTEKYIFINMVEDNDDPKGDFFSDVTKRTFGNNDGGCTANDIVDVFINFMEACSFTPNVIRSALMDAIKTLEDYETLEINVEKEKVPVINKETKQEKISEKSTENPWDTCFNKCEHCYDQQECPVEDNQGKLNQQYEVKDEDDDEEMYNDMYDDCFCPRSDNILLGEKIHCPDCKYYAEDKKQCKNHYFGGDADITLKYNDKGEIISCRITESY